MQTVRVHNVYRERFEREPLPTLSAALQTVWSKSRSVSRDLLWCPLGESGAAGAIVGALVFKVLDTAGLAGHREVWASILATQTGLDTGTAAGAIVDAIGFKMRDAAGLSLSREVWASIRATQTSLDTGASAGAMAPLAVRPPTITAPGVAVELSQWFDLTALSTALRRGPKIRLVYCLHIVSPTSSTGTPARERGKQNGRSAQSNGRGHSRRAHARFPTPNGHRCAASGLCVPVALIQSDPPAGEVATPCRPEA
ncbi:hypothetical protein [Carbonactinospora thermoautotrophica]|uniref:hypothetical protein n=1 Tax=Carbonactinospora thermoautotrophica TaxID=1469144 RepID=UPI001300DA3A|nr:hypothetical protein [Carbonactinospora thermoautotrophica]